MKKALDLSQTRILQDRRSSVLAVAFVGVLLFGLLSPASTHLVSAWSNGGNSTDPSKPKYGTHDWIAERALDWLPANEKALILNYRAAYLYGTELPDNAGAPGGDGIGDSRCCHHLYYHSNGTLQDDISAKRATDMQNQALAAFAVGDYSAAAKWTGAMTHYIDDLASFGHVMGAETDWGAEPSSIHSSYENHIESLTDSPGASIIPIFFDGTLAATSAYNATLALAHDTTFDESGMGHTAVWMNLAHNNWSDEVFTSRAYQSINLAVNYVAEAVHTTWSAKGQQHTTTTSNLPTTFLSAFTTVTAIILGNQKRKQKKHRRKIVKKKQTGSS